ncbi:MAG: hypothetical protein M1826_002410 [Phylliscum demangeonii]|nr:MAG: hypothetical protein M1826_002410 [Phylliscum demangeonii]
MTLRTTKSSATAGSHAARRTQVHQPPQQQQQSRSTAPSTTSTTATTIQVASDTRTTTHPNEEMVVRDANGDYQVQELELPVDEQDAVEENESSKEKDREKLAEAIRLHLKDRNRRLTDPTELLTAVHQNLRDVAASIKDDNWMFEADDG